MEMVKGEMLPQIVSVSPVIQDVLKIVWNDSYEGVVELRPLLEKVNLGEYGHSIYWIDDKGYEIDLSADSLRRDAERQAELHRQAG